MLEPTKQKGYGCLGKQAPRGNEFFELFQMAEEASALCRFLVGRLSRVFYELVTYCKVGFIKKLWKGRIAALPVECYVC